ncbi:MULTISPECIES: helix-hairpin-helix domain-containing protein [Microbulbifer]|uniref:ComEA family DNA-binding protein n=1 Tax=Microbulbifer TaxID=48073 RepID=UPI001E398E41|nr:MULTISPECIES: helix-hairpin-helix domain-containing protein [Microbulbifer]UHQ55307.1 helix-hairpin-helix domain-containing protein [Microbulbifer sp. YPW16]
MKLIRIPLLALFAVFVLVYGSSYAVADEVAGDKEADVAAMAASTININQSTAEDIAAVLEGVGPVRAEMIIKYREENGPFTSVEQLLEIKGIGTATLDKNRDKITL